MDLCPKIAAKVCTRSSASAALSSPEFSHFEAFKTSLNLLTKTIYEWSFATLQKVHGKFSNCQTLSCIHTRIRKSGLTNQTHSVKSKIKLDKKKVRSKYWKLVKT